MTRDFYRPSNLIGFNCRGLRGRCQKLLLYGREAVRLVVCPECQTLYCVRREANGFKAKAFSRETRTMMRQRCIAQ